MKAGRWESMGMGKSIAFFRNLQIRSKLMMGYTLIFIMATLSGGSVIYFQVKSTIEANIENDLKNSTATILNMVKTAASTSIKNHLRAVAENNREILASIYRDQTLGLMTETAAKSLAKKSCSVKPSEKPGICIALTAAGWPQYTPAPGLRKTTFLTTGLSGNRSD
ncbi:MAG: hypothetical protein V1793_13730 [Pseudomonadota bacterium]